MAILVTGGIYIGDGLDNKQVTVGFQPDVVIVREHFPGGTMAIRTSTMSSGNSEDVVAVNGTSTTRIKTFNATGFTVGTSVDINDSGVEYYWQAFTVDGSGVDVFTYTGNGADDRNVGSLGFQPDHVWVFPATTAAAYIGSTVFPAGNSISWAGAAFSADAVQGFHNSGIQVGTVLNANTIVYHVVAFRERPGVLSQVSYTGNGADNRNIAHTLNQVPKWCIVRRTNATTNAWMRIVSDLDETSWDVTATASNGDRIQAMTGTANIQLGANADVNLNATAFDMFVFGTGAGGGGGGNGGRPPPSPGNTPLNFAGRWRQLWD